MEHRLAGRGKFENQILNLYREPLKQIERFFIKNSFQMQSRNPQSFVLHKIGQACICRH